MEIIEIKNYLEHNEILDISINVNKISYSTSFPNSSVTTIVFSSITYPLSK